MEQTRAINALAPFLALSKSANSPRAAADLISQATAAPNTYVFAELLQTQPVQALRNEPQYAGYYKLLEIFAWGTWEDYQVAATATNTTLPPLTSPQSTKLRLLTLLTLAARGSGVNLSYPSLQTALSLPTSFDLEQLVTEAIYNNLLTATLDPHHQTVIVSSVAPLRDLAPGAVGSMIASLDAWSARCGAVAEDLEAEIARVKREAKRRAEAQALRAQEFEQATEAVGKQGQVYGGGGGNRLGGDDDGEAMDVDDAGGRGKRKAAQKAAAGFFRQR